MLDSTSLTAMWSRAAHPHQVPSTIHPDDLLWQFLETWPQFSTPDDAAHHYFDDGATSARQLAEILTRHPRQARTGPVHLLEFASGYGMVTRHLPAALSNVHITSCDIHSAAVEFINNELGGQAVLSTHNPENLEFHRHFDVVFALSFFSHMPDSSFGRWLAALYRAVRPGGILAFTTHGARSHEIFGQPELDQRGYWFHPNSEQTDLSGAEYGSTVTLPPYVIEQLYQHTRAPLAEYRAAYWWHHQDLWIAAKPA